MDFDEWLGVSVEIGSKEKTCHTYILYVCMYVRLAHTGAGQQEALKEAWDKDILEEDDIPLDDRCHIGRRKAISRVFHGRVHMGN